MFDDSELPPPPPAYSEQEFDRKVSTALEVSLTVHQPEPSADDDEWEVWDEALFRSRVGQTPASSVATGSALQERPAPSSTAGSVAPLRVHKKNNSSSSNTPATKPRPSWYDEAGLEGGPSDTTSEASVGGSGPSKHPLAEVGSSTKPRPSWYREAAFGQTEVGSSGISGANVSAYNAGTSSSSTSPDSYQPQDHNPHDEQPPLPPGPQAEDSSPSTIHHSVEGVEEGEEEDNTLPPPPFTAVGPSLDGPPFEEVATLSYSGHDSTSPSPLASPQSPVAELPHLNPSVLQPVPQESAIPASLIPGPRTPSRSSINSDYQSRGLARQSLSPSPVVHSNLPSRVRPSSANSPTRHISPSLAPQIEFNPYVAYGKRDERIARSQPAPIFDPTAFYNSAVSAHITTPHRYPQRPQTMEGHQFSGSYNHLQQPPHGRPGYNQWAPQPSAPSQHAPQYNPQQANPYGQAYPGGGMAGQEMKPDPWHPQNQPYSGRYY